METPKGLLIVLHNGFANIPVQEALKAIPVGWQGLHREVVEVSYSELLDLTKLYDTGYEQFALEHRRFFSSRILDTINSHPDYKVLYFGLAPIPLCIDLGHLFYNYRNVLVFQKHHVTKEWYYDALPAESGENVLKVEGIPEKDQKGISEALIRLSISHPINPDDAYALLPNAAEIDIALDNPDEDAVTSEEKMIEIGETVKQAFDDLSNNRSNLGRIHLFAAIPCGVAFLVGTKISPNIHSMIQTYQFSRTKEPRYTKALLIKGPIVLQRPVTDEDRESALELRTLSNENLTVSVKEYLQDNESMSRNRDWFTGIIPKLNASLMQRPFWKNLPAIYETSLKDDSFDFEAKDINGGFYWRMKKWFVDDNFFIAVNKRLKAKEDILMAVRLFLFHEALHYYKHNLTDLTSLNIGSFPKVLETADYQADVYAIMNEYGYYNKLHGQITDPKQYFLNAIRVATETMWSFDDNGVELEEIQIRRLNRYMIWYFQQARIEKEGETLDDIIAILEEKPVIELNGLKTKEENNRFFFILEKRKDQPLELGVFHENKLIRDGSASNLAIESMIQGVKQLDGNMILTIMRSFVSR